MIAVTPLLMFFANKRYIFSELLIPNYPVNDSTEN